MATDTPVLVATVSRTVGRRDTTYAVIHLPDEVGVPYCPWLGPVEPMTAVQANRLGAVGCNRCPQIKQARTRT